MLETKHGKPPIGYVTRIVIKYINNLEMKKKQWINKYILYKKYKNRIRISYVLINYITQLMYIQY